MKKIGFVILLALCGCFRSTTVQTVQGTETTASVMAPGYVTMKVKDEPKSFWRVCMQEHEGYSNAQALCDELTEASRPGALPVCGTPGAYMPVWYYGGYSSPTNAAQMRCREPKTR